MSARFRPFLSVLALRILDLWNYVAAVTFIGGVSGMATSGAIAQYESNLGWVRWTPLTWWMPTAAAILFYLGLLCSILIFSSVHTFAVRSLSKSDGKTPSTEAEGATKCSAEISRRSFYECAGAGLIIFLATYLPLNMLGLLFPWALFLLSLGLAVQSVRIFRARRELVFRISRVAATLVLVAMIATIVSIQLKRNISERRLEAALPSAPSDSPNILFIVWDTVRAKDVGTFADDGIPTPNLDRLAGQGIVYERAIAPSSWTLPSHASMFTGRFPNELSADWATPLDEEEPAIAELLMKEGYYTAGFVANPYCGHASGINRGFIHYEADEVNVRVLVAHHRVGQLLEKRFPQLACRKRADEIVDDFLTWNDPSEDRPFFAFLNFMDAHDPYLPETLTDGRSLSQEERNSMFDWRLNPPDEVNANDQDLAVECYRSQISYLDNQLGRLLDELETRNTLEDTVVILVSDHGEHFGEHNVYYHGNSLYQEVVHVPLVIAGPGVEQAGLRITNPISTRNVGVTALQLAGSEAFHDFPGKSLLPSATALEDEASEVALVTHEQSVYSHISLEQYEDHCTFGFFIDSPAWKDPLNLWVRPDYSLISSRKGKQELYDTVNDYFQENDLSNSPMHAEGLRTMTQQLQSFLKEADEQP
jgi:arylsulfatase A-like enzyme